MYQRKWALISGASSGIGKEMALQLAQKGMNLILVARRKVLLDEIKSQAEALGVVCKVLVLDVTNNGAVEQIKQWLLTHQIKLHVLINNAGRGLYGSFFKQDVTEMIAMIQLNIQALTLLSREIAPLIEKGGHLMLVASTIAYIPVPQYSAYAATKSYVHTFGYALADELYPDISVTTLYPGVTNTAFFEISHHHMARWLRAILMYESDYVARVGIKAMFAKKTRKIVGPLNQFLSYIVRLSPDRLNRFLLKYLFNLAE
ncbi:SDR family NAD(P)-dependent oxidoreductase [Gammaproteobacteria bacterium]|nr:SDR family NAD(P)-dependent oxidoreductase [Gammaproteobacteria bacterium]